MTRHARALGLWTEIRVRPYQGLAGGVAPVIAGAIVTVQGPHVSFSTTAVLGPVVDVVHLIGLAQLVGGLMMLHGMRVGAPHLEGAAGLTIGAALSVYAVLLAIAYQLWAGPYIACLCVAGVMKWRQASRIQSADVALLKAEKADDEP